MSRVNEASESRYSSRVSKHLITWVQLEDPQVTWLCFPLRLQENSELADKGEKESNLLETCTREPDYVEERSNLDDLREEFSERGFLLQAINESIVGFDETIIDQLIETVLYGNFPGASDRIPKGKNKREPKVQRLIELYNGKYSSDGIYRLMIDILKYNSDIAENIISTYKTQIQKNKDSEFKRRESKVERRKLSDICEKGQYPRAITPS